MMESTSFINQMLAPSVLISGIGFLLFNFNTHYVSLIDKIDHFDDEIFRFKSLSSLSDLENDRLTLLKRNNKNLILRCKVTKYAIFVLYLAIIFTVFSVLAIAFEIGNIHTGISHLPIIAFVIAVSLLLIAIIIEIYEFALALKRFDKDFRAQD